MHINRNRRKNRGGFWDDDTELDRSRDLLVEHGVGRAAMESTSIYWLPVWRVLDTTLN